MLATVGNIRKLTRKLNPGREHMPIGYLNPLSHFGIVAYDDFTGDTYSADAGDYFSSSDSIVLKNDSGKPLTLGRKRTKFEPIEMEDDNG